MMNRKMTSFRVLVLTVVLLAGAVIGGHAAKSYYYYEDFSSQSSVMVTNGWNTNYCMSRDFWNDNSSAARFTISNVPGLQRMIMIGDPNGNTAYDQWYTGKGTIFRPISNSQMGKQDVTATEEDPFGYMVVRYGSYVHRENTNPHDLDAYGNLDPNYGKSLLEVWMAEDNGAYQFGDSFDNFVFWYDKAFNRWSSSDGGSQTLSNNIWGYYNLYERDNSGYYDTSWTNFIDIDGNSINPNAAFRRQYSWTNTAAYALNESGTNGGAATNEMAIKMVHNGKKITIYLNLDPAGDDSATLKNSWIKYAEVPVAWSTKLVAYFAAESPTPNAAWQYTYAQYKNFLIRSVNSNLVASIYPTNAAPNQLTVFSLYITNYMGTTNDSGIGEIAIKKPASYVSNWILTNVWVSNQYGVLTNTNTNMNPNAGNFSLTTNQSGEMVIRFRATASGDQQVVTNNNSVIKIDFQMYTPATANSAGETFEVYADCVKHSDTGQDIVFSGSGIKYATTGRKKAVPAFTGGMLVRTYNGPVGYSSLLPTKVYEGVETVYQYDIAAANPDNNANVTKAMIRIPDGFGVDTNLLYSEKMYVSNGMYLYLTNLGVGTNAVVADYGLKGVFLPANGGWDTITIKCTNTTNVPDGSTNGVTVSWPAQVYSSLTGLWTNTGTNSFYPTQNLVVRKKPPQGTISVTPNEVSNTVLSNIYEIVIRNTATEDPNRLKIVRIKLPAVFTNVISMTSASNGVITTNQTNGSNWITVSYTNTPPDTYIPANGGYDVIRLVLADNVGSLTDMTNYGITAEGDNINGEGFITTLGEATAGSGNVLFYTPPANAYAHLENPGPEGGSGTEHNIYTDMDVETNLALVLENKGEEGNHISMARIVFPAGITNVQYVGDTKLAQPTLTNEYTTNGVAGVTNTNRVLYLSYTNTLKTKIGATLAEQDYVNLKIWDAIDAPANEHIDVYVKNTKTNYSAATEVPDTTMLTYIYPMPSVKGYVYTADGFIDWSSETNTVDYYITNMGRAKNEILQAQIVIPSWVSTNIPVGGITSTLVTNAGSIAYNGGVITVNYGGGNGFSFSGGLEDRIRFQMIDLVTNTVTVRLTNTVTNNRTNVILPETATNAQNLNFQTPPVMAKYRVEPSVLFVQTSGTVTDQIVLTVTNQGSGNNHINQVRITAPFTSAKVSEIHDSVMDTNMTAAPGLVNMTGSLITLYYTNTAVNLAAGTVDTVTVYLKNDYTTEQDFGWSVSADNDLSDGVGFTNIGVQAGYTNRTYIVEKGQVYADPNTVVTATYSNYIRYSLKNGTVGDGNGRPIYRAKIIVTDPFTNVAGITMEQAGSYTVTNIDASTMWVLVDYAGGLQAGEADNIRFWLADNWYVGTNYAVLSSQVDYLDGGGWRDTAEESGKSTGISFTFPPASATGYILSGEWVPEDFTNYTYQFYLKNTGESGNDIKLIKITPPATITNITSVTCLTKQVGGTYDGTNVWIDYAGAGKLLSTLETDTVQLVGYDNATSGPVYTEWGVKVANTVSNDESYRIAVTVPGNKSLSNLIYHPVTKTSTYLEAVNAIDGADSNKNKVWTTKTSNVFKYYIYNQSDSGNNVTKARIFIPGGAVFFDTNSLVVSNDKGGCYLTNNRTEIWIDYVSELVPGDFDTVEIRVNDNYSYGETNLEWTNDVAYDTTDGHFKASLEYTGKSRKSYFVMPAPLAKSGIVSPIPGEIYVKTTNFVLGYTVTNTGDGTSDLFNVMLTIPGPFRALFATNDVSNSLATNALYDSGAGVLTLNYSNNFKPGTNDLIYLTLKVASGILSVTNYDVGCQVSNYTYLSAAGDTGVNSKVLNVVNVPTYYVTPNTLSTTTSSNDVNVFILNNTGGQAKLKKVVLAFAVPFTNINQTNSAKITNLSHISGDMTNLTLDFEADLHEISAGGTASIRFGLEDGFEVGDMTTCIRAMGWNGNEWVEMEKDVGGQTNIDFVMPSADATAMINYTQIYTTTEETNIGIVVTNYGTGSNKLSRVKIHVPGGLTNLTVLSNLYYTDAVTAVTNGTVYVTYQDNNLFNTGMTDVIWLGYSNTITTATNVSFTVEGVNLTNGAIDARYVTVPGEGGAGALNLRVDFPPVSVQGYINGRSQFFTINTNDKVEYRIVNGSINSLLTNARIYYDTGLFRITSVSNTWAGASWTTNADYLEISYGAPGIQFSQRDIVTLQMLYNITNITNTMLTSTVVLVTNGVSNSIATVDAGYTQLLGVTVASWGKIKGQVYPTNYTVNAKVYYPGTTTIATNIDGELASTVTLTNGEYAFSFIPNGLYTLELSATMFRAYRTNVTVNSNMENLVSIITMQNALMSPDVGTNQTAVCYDDNKTKIVFPGSSLGRDISININLFDLTQPQKDDLGNNSNVNAPSTTTGMKGYKLNVKNLSDNQVEGEVLKLDATLYLAYDASDVTSRGWSEDSLAIYYWDRVPGKWVKVGGVVDKVNGFVTAKVSYVHDIYGVFSGKAGQGVIRNVAVRPRIFTPTKSENGYFGSVRISFELDQLQAADGYEVKIYNLRGALVKSFSRKGAYSQGEIAWDSKDEEGYPVKGGVYVYRVLAGGQSYSGVIVIAR